MTNCKRNNGEPDKKGSQFCPGCKWDKYFKNRPEVQKKGFTEDNFILQQDGVWELCEPGLVLLGLESLENKTLEAPRRQEAPPFVEDTEFVHRNPLDRAFEQDQTPLGVFDFTTDDPEPAPPGTGRRVPKWF
ncbi:hypothetical protein MMC10_009452 [Thelotrema lepadinum]|nr:hypothetical protein [Thelotrema lepadinum]